MLNNRLDERKERLARQLGVLVIHLPMKVRHISYTLAARSAAIVADRGHQPILVYCSEGSDRTGLVVALYRMMAQGWNMEQIMTEMLTYNFRPPRNPKIVYYLLREMKEMSEGNAHPLRLDVNEEDDEKAWRACKRELANSNFLELASCWKTGA